MACAPFGQTLEEFSFELPFVSIVRINVMHFQEISEKYCVMSVPTIIMLKDGQEALRHIGALSLHDLKMKLSGHFY